MLIERNGYSEHWERGSGDRQGAWISERICIMAAFSVILSDCTASKKQAPAFLSSPAVHLVLWSQGECPNNIVPLLYFLALGIRSRCQSAWISPSRLC